VAHAFTARDVRRILSALAHSAEDGDPADLADLLAIRDYLDRCIADTVHHMRTVQEFTWGSIAEALGVTKQAAQQRWGRP
jgi:hypothetical protein